MELLPDARDGDIQKQFLKNQNAWTFTKFCYNSLMLYPTHTDDGTALTTLTESDEEDDGVDDCKELKQMEDRAAEIPACDKAKIKELYSNKSKKAAQLLLFTSKKYNFELGSVNGIL